MSWLADVLWALAIGLAGFLLVRVVRLLTCYVRAHLVWRRSRKRMKAHLDDLIRRGRHEGVEW